MYCLRYKGPYLVEKLSGVDKYNYRVVCQPTRYISFWAATLTDLNASRHLSSPGPKMIPLVAFSLGLPRIATFLILIPSLT